MGVKAQDGGREDDGVFPVAVRGLGNNAVQLAGVDEPERFRADGEGFHVDFQPEFPAGKIQDLHFVMPVVLDKSAFSHGMGAVDGAGKRLCPVRPDFLEYG